MPRIRNTALIYAQVPVHEDTILRIFLIGLHKSLPLNGQDCLTIAETMIKRAAGLHALASKGFPILYRWGADNLLFPFVVYSVQDPDKQYPVSGLII
jgi:hypothetical protein